MKLEILEMIINLMTILMIAISISIPVITFVIGKKIKFKNSLIRFGVYFVLNSMLLGVLTLAFTYWNEELSKLIILRQFGFNMDGMNEAELLQNVKSENKIRMKEIYDSMHGIGWPLKAMLTYVVFSLPYSIFITLFLNFFVKKTRNYL